MSARAVRFSVSAIVSPADEDNEVWGVTLKTGTSVTVYNGTSNTGVPIIALTAPGTISLNNPIRCDKGVYVEVAGGTPSGSVHM